ncbi:hypothetical protein J4234_01855 [Candidatus Woesearchaeota archaeon]|nr:hypothetical protein [Candidatus Woesearchaeota archaeon]
MAFFRIKKIKGKEYAYIVENEWKKKGSRQKVMGYLGRVYRFSLMNDVGFLEHLKIDNIENYVNNNDAFKIMSHLIEWELYRFNINKNEFLIDLSNKKIQKKDKNIAFFINEGFMCSLALKNLLEFKPEGDEQADAYRLARAFVEAGIKVPQEIFICIFGKLYKKME